MSRLFDDAQNEYLGIAQALAAPPFAIVCRFNTDDDTGAAYAVGISDTGSNDNYHGLCIHQTSNTIYAQSEGGASWGAAITSTTWSLNTWHHACAIFASSTDRRALLDGGGKGTNATAVTPAGLDTTTIGILKRLAVGMPLSGMIAEVAIYDLSEWPGATASDKADNFEKILPSLAAGYSPACYPLGLVAHYRLIRDEDTDIVGGFNMTPYNTPSIGSHPRVIYPTRALSELFRHEVKTVAGTSDGQSTAVAATKVARKIAVTSDGQSTAGATAKVTRRVAGTADAQSTATCALKVLRKIACTADGQSTASCTASITVFIAGTAAAQSTAMCTATVFVFIVATADGQSTAVCAVKVSRKIVCTADGQSTATCAVTIFVHIICTAAGQSTASATAIVIYAEIPPFMEKDLIDPYESGAWLWLVEIAVPTQTTQRIARNTEDVSYRGNVFSKFNLQVSEQVFSGDGSIPRVTLKVFQDINRKMEDIINATEGALGGQVKLIRVNEKYLGSPVIALEADYDNLASESDSEWCTFTLGIPNPLTQRFPLRIYSSSTCPWATPTLFKECDCQYAGEDTTCTGTYEDCYTKGNAVHWGAELGLDPNTIKV